MVAVFLWIGFVAAISFMEAWLKFRAPGVTLPVGLAIGRLVFHTLNRVEWVLATAILMDLILSVGNTFSPRNRLYFVALGILLIQSVWLLPVLDARAELHIRGEAVSPSSSHFYYVGVEMVKVSCLLIFGITLFKKQ